ncbi:MAG: hypothetical protein MUO84_07765 [Thermoplasmata archaeon]|nr:hypothetical protein [Thermoplasmata archaeon]
MSGFEMDTLVAILVTITMVVVVLFILITGIHIIRPGQIGFLYRGKTFIRDFGPSIVFGPPLISRMYKINRGEVLHFILDSSSTGGRRARTTPGFEIEVTLDITDPSKVPVLKGDLKLEAHGIVSRAMEKAISHIERESETQDQAAIARELRIVLEKSLKVIGLRPAYIRAGNHKETTSINPLATARVPLWDDLQSRLGD